MSYILDALKKSDKERQQGTSPHLYSIHSSAPVGRKLSPLHLRLGLWLFMGGILLFIVSLGILFFLNRQSVPPSVTALDANRTATLEQPAGQAANQGAKQAPDQLAGKNPQTVPQVIIKEKNIVLRSVAVKDKALPSSRRTVSETAPGSVPLFQDLSADIRAEVPELKFAGHTYSDDPAQRMIIVNGQIVREGDTIAPSTHLSEITWEGVIIDFNGTRFLIRTN